MDTKTSRAGESENVEAQPPLISFDPDTLRLGVGSDIACVVQGHKLVVVYGDVDIVGANLFGTAFLPSGKYGVWSYTHGVPSTQAAADIGRLAAVRRDGGAWKVFDPRVSALLPRVDAQLED